MKHKSRIRDAIRSLRDLGQEDVVAIEMIAQVVRHALKVLGARTAFHVLQSQINEVIDELGREYERDAQEQRRLEVAAHIEHRTSPNHESNAAIIT